MATASKNYVSIVALGRQNPQILTVDFLRAQKVVPENRPPFSEILRAEKPFSEFISTPPFTKLVLGPIEFMVDDQRFQVRENSVANWSESIVPHIAEKYYEALPHTPLRIVGVNFNSTLTFDSSAEAHAFQTLFFPENAKIAGILPEKSVSASIVLRFHYPKNAGRVTLTIERPDATDVKRGFNFNYEFDFTDWSGFKAELERSSEIAAYADSMTDDLLKALQNG